LTDDRQRDLAAEHRQLRESTLARAADAATEAVVATSGGRQIN
jgi:hypothetical protein